ncbi:MAG: hypothetical protein ACI8QZ_001341 [Chlamydiales bacterium]
MRVFCWWIAGCALSLAACASGGGKSGQVRSLEELPEHYRVVWEAFRGADPGWPGMRAEVRAEPALRDFVVDNLVREMLLAYGRADLARAEHPATRHFHRTRAELVEYPIRSSEVLSELLGVGNGAATYLASDILNEIGRPALPVVVGQLESPRVQARQWAARLLAGMPHALEAEPGVLAALTRHLTDDEDWLTRAQCAKALGRRGSTARATRDLRDSLALALRDPDGGVRRAAAKGLAELDDPAAVPALIDYLERGLGEGALTECVAAEAALSALTGSRGGLGVQGWRELWRSQRP